MAELSEVFGEPGGGRERCVDRDQSSRMRGCRGIRNRISLLRLGSRSRLERRGELFEELPHPFGRAAESRADRLQRRGGGAVPERRDQPGLELTGRGQHHARRGTELQFGRGAPHERKERIDAR
ncbi:hypothetical protein DCE93_04300 [Agromyces badenianii]|uniref:Uncharacterized protein n=1 Tax=Agromyces badenianii TaxID=2080742 RepID=A0A2S0WUK6_9MICO|nr:hypothetical protein DCE93_04300 [Agromyces badenianii]